MKKKPIAMHPLNSVKVTGTPPDTDKVIAGIRSLIEPYYDPSKTYHVGELKEALSRRSFTKPIHFLDPFTPTQRKLAQEAMEQAYPQGTLLPLDDIAYILGNTYVLTQYGTPKKNVDFAFHLATKGLPKAESARVIREFLEDTDRIQKEGLCLRLREAMGRARITDLTSAVNSPLQIAEIIRQYRKDAQDKRNVPAEPVVFDGIDFPAAHYLWHHIALWWTQYPALLLPDYSQSRAHALDAVLSRPDMSEMVLWDNPLAEEAQAHSADPQDRTRVTRALAQLPKNTAQAHFLTLPDRIPDHKTTPCLLLGYGAKASLDTQGRRIILGIRVLARNNGHLKHPTIDERAPILEVMGWATENEPVPQDMEPIVRLLEFMTREVVEYVPDPTSLVPLVHPKDEAPPQERAGRLGHYSTVLLRRVRLAVQTTGEAPRSPDSPKDGAGTGCPRTERSQVRGHERTVRYGPGRCYTKTVWIEDHESPSDPSLPLRDKAKDPVRRVRVKR